MFDGLENYLLKNISHRYTLNDEDINCIRQQFRQNKFEQYAEFPDWFSVRVRVYRYVDNVLILGKASQQQFLDIYIRLVLFFKDRGLSVKKNPVEVFLPGAKFEFLGFQFQYLDYKNCKGDKRKYMRYPFSEPYMVLKGLCSTPLYNNLLITICSKSYKCIMSKFKLLFSRDRAGLPIKVLIKDYNE